MDNIARQKSKFCILKSFSFGAPAPKFTTPGTVFLLPIVESDLKKQMGESAPVDELKRLSEEPEESGSSRRTSSRLSGQKRPFYGSSSQRKVSSPDANSEDICVSENRKSKRTKTSSVDLEQDGKEEIVEGKKPNKTKASLIDLDQEGKEEIVEEKEPVDERNADILVKKTLRLFQKYHLQQIQEEQQRCARVKSNGKKGCKESSHSSRRPDLKALTKLVETDKALYRAKRFGKLPGIPVGFKFYSRAEVVALGVHTHWLKGIDFMTQSKYGKLEQYKEYNFPLAVSIVISGMYEDGKDTLDEVVYTGEGGNDLLGNKQQVGNQVMRRGNLALKNSMEQNIPIRVIRGHKFSESYTGKLYTYDGLYEIKGCWDGKGQSGFTVIKFQLNRMKGQPQLTTNHVDYVRAHLSQSQLEISGKVCDDISEGQERIKVAAFNLVDDPPVGPTGYTYCKSVRLAKGVTLPTIGTGCSCKGACTDADKCACAKLNGSDFPYVDIKGGRLVEAKTVVFECGPNCKCGPNCVNRTSQQGLRFRLEVFRTPNKGWAPRSRDFIPSGSPVCEYTGTLMRTKDMNTVSENDYIFEIDCLETMEGLDGRESRLGVVSIPGTSLVDKHNNNELENDPEFCIDAGTFGGVARFINHSCDPNLFVQCVLSSHHDIRLARVMLFASDNIPPLQELTYDYGYALDSVIDKDGKPKVMPCHCGAKDCRKRLY